MLLGFGRVLQGCCEVVASVSNGHEAIEAVGRLAPDVLVVDLMMPDLDGLEVCRRVKEAAPQIDVVIVTAYDDPDVQAIALKAGASAFVPKHSAVAMLQPAIQQAFVDRQRIA